MPGAESVARAARERAEKELQDEQFDRAVEDEKRKLRQRKPLLHRLFPWKISVTRR